MCAHGREAINRQHQPDVSLVSSNVLVALDVELVRLRVAHVLHRRPVGEVVVVVMECLDDAVLPRRFPRNLGGKVSTRVETTEGVHNWEPPEDAAFAEGALHVAFLATAGTTAR